MRHTAILLPCAWVLWTQAIAGRPFPYVYHDAYETKEACVEATKTLPAVGIRLCLPVGIKPNERQLWDQREGEVLQEHPARRQ